MAGVTHDDSVEAVATVEAWQTRPDGTYSSLRSGKDEGDCRARVIADPKSSQVKLETVAPGSFGSLGGLVPSPFFDWSPYGPPALHLLISAPEIMGVPTLVDLPMLLDSDSLEPKEFSFAADWRGHGWMKPLKVNAKAPEKSNPVKLSKWTAKPDENRIEASYDILIEKVKSPTNKTASDIFCDSLFYGLPSSFFLEPMSICAPSMLDFFAV
uniref:Uncharacterized protein n=1 Tax=Entomoneis paludosa TaxID=265537 RepID=A0A7S2YRZ8_9STRA